MTPQVSLRRALTDPALLGGVLGGPSWLAWRVMLLASMGEPLELEELDAFRRLTGRHAPPPGRVEEFWGVIGRRGGKSTAMAALACYLGGLCDHRDVLSAGERGVVLCIAPDQRQARIALGYAEGILESTPLMRQLIVSRTADTLELTTGAVIEVRSASFRRLRGVTCLAAVADEAAYWMSSDEFSQNPDREILDAVRPSLATTGGPLIVISSPYARRGEVWATYSKHFGADGDPLILVAQGASRDFNPSLPQSVIDRAVERDPASAAAEYLGQFRTDIESLLPIEAVRACIRSDATERQPNFRNRYYAFTDPSGGSSDSMTLAIGHKEADTSILDAVREWRPPFSPEAVVHEACALLQKYRCTKVRGDRWGGEFVAEQFKRGGVFYEPTEFSKSELYIDLVGLVNSGAVDLLKNERLVQQLTGLERRTTRGGRDTVDHPPGGHDDLANCVAGALTCAHAGRGAVRPRIVHESCAGYDVRTGKYRPRLEDHAR
jgi:hypothetical protein